MTEIVIVPIEGPVVRYKQEYIGKYMGNQCKRKKEYMGYPLKNRKNIWEIHLFSLQSSQGIWGGDTFLLFFSTQQKGKINYILAFCQSNVVHRFAL